MELASNANISFLSKKKKSSDLGSIVKDGKPWVSFQGTDKFADKISVSKLSVQSNFLYTEFF